MSRSPGTAQLSAVRLLARSLLIFSSRDERTRNLPVSSLPTMFGRATALQSDQHRLFTTFQLLHESCGAMEPVGRAGTRSKTVRLFEDLLAALSTHFSAEEADGYFGAIVAERPSLSRAISALKAEHAAMLTALGALSHLAASGTPSIRLVGAVQRCAHWFHAHEQRESQTVGDFLLPIDPRQR